MCQMHQFICDEVGIEIKMLLLASLYVFITQCNKLYFQYSSIVIGCVSVWLNRDRGDVSFSLPAVPN